jgi:flagellar biosynthesis/type III secretory pathway protein FliH
MTDFLQELREVLDEYRAAAVLEAIRDEHKRKYVKVAVHPSQYEVVRQAVCNADPQMESAVISRSIVKTGTVILMNTSILERSFLPDFPNFNDKS